MNNDLHTTNSLSIIDEPAVDRVGFDFAVDRRDFLRTLGAGLLIVVSGGSALAQVPGGGRQGGGRQGGSGRRGGGGGFAGGPPPKISARVHIAQDGTVTVMTGKVECGQGARAELTQAAAEELRLRIDRVHLLMADTANVPDDGMTAGSRSTPSTVPAIRQGCAAARDLLVGLAAKRWNADRAALTVRDGKVVDAKANRELSYADLASAPDAADLFNQVPGRDVTITPVKDWAVLGVPTPRPNGRDLVTGAHHYPSDIVRPGMLYGKVLRAPSYGAKLTSIDLAPAKAMTGVVAVQDGSFVGVAAPTSYVAEEALAAIEKTAKWETAPHPSSKTIFDYLRDHARGGMPANPFADELAKAAKSFKQTYHVAYVQHAPLEPRAAVAEWSPDGKLTVWTGTQGPFGVRGELARTFGLSNENVRVIVPDFGAAFGGKHSGECAVEAARLAKAAGKPVKLRWTRQEEFTWAYFRPAGVIEAQASLDDQGNLTSWHFVNVNSGPSSIETPYKAGKARSQFVGSEPPLRQGSYRGLAATANTFARECAMDELAALARRDPLEFRLAHLANNARLHAVLAEAANRFGWSERAKNKRQNIGVGLACGTEKGSYVATCAEVAIDPSDGKISVKRIVQTFECGAVINPANLTAQNQGAICMALGPALREEIRFENGRILTDAFSDYAVPRFADVPQVEVHLIDRKDLASAGAGETPLISVAPAIANAVHHATGHRLREMPLRLPKQA
ncbi:MAG TPA: molybdopterin cofactor-binding domain-containing protein [Tepidisphaeraceae bacterium]|jgi:isoquinoline 1-oxidoreductase